MLSSTSAWLSCAFRISLLLSSNRCDGSTQSLGPSAASTAFMFNTLFQRLTTNSIFLDFDVMSEAAFLLCCGV